MAHVIKTDPMQAMPGDALQISEKPMYDGDRIRPGDEVFIWFSEKAGGEGLAWQGHVASIVNVHSQEIAATVRLTNYATARLGKDILEPLRNVRDGRPLSELAQKLYYHAHNKVAAISQEAAEALRFYFDPDANF